MHAYIPFLLEDIAKAYRKPFAEEKSFNESIENHFEAIEKWLYEDPPSTFGDYCGLKSEDFPPAEQLSEEDMVLVIAAFKKMMASWNLDIYLPDKLPVSIAYSIVVDTLNQKTAIVDNGFLCFDYCSGSPEGCVFKEYCPCLDISIDFSPEDMDEDFDDENLPD